MRRWSAGSGGRALAEVAAKAGVADQSHLSNNAPD
jgi:hypothetical protein